MALATVFERFDHVFYGHTRATSVVIFYSQADSRATPPGGVRRICELPEGDHRHQQVGRQSRPGLREVRGVNRDVEGSVQHFAGMMRCGWRLTLLLRRTLSHTKFKFSEGAKGTSQ